MLWDVAQMVSPSLDVFKTCLAMSCVSLAGAVSGLR